MKYKETARRLLDALDNKGMRPIDLANKTGISKGSISQYCTGTHAPSKSSAEKMAEILEVQPLWLLGYDVPVKSEYDDDVDQILEAISRRKELKNLLDASSELSKDDVQFLIDMIKRMGK